MNIIGGNFTNVRHVQTRGVYQFIIEVDKLNASHVLQALGGLPDAANPKWVDMFLRQDKTEE